MNLIIPKTALAAVFFLLPALAVAAPDGAELYEKHCVVCHRADGAGSLGIPLATEKFKVTTDDYLRKTIRYGRPGRVMPPFMTLSDAQVDAIVRHLRTITGTKPYLEPEFTAVGDLERGRVVFAAKCEKCHGDEGESGGQGTGVTYSRPREFKVIPPAIANNGFLRSSSDEMLRHVITHGRRGTDMASAEKLELSEQDIHDLIIFLRDLGEQQEKLVSITEDEEPTLFFDSPYDFKTTIANVKQALSGSNFRSFPDRYIEEGIWDEFAVNKKQVSLRFCNFNQLYDVLRIEPRIGTVLPCRITVVENEDGSVQLIVMNMAVVTRLFNNTQLQQAGARMHETLMNLLEEATL
ncbi:MAG: c-type cytochrome [Gammaproteobacteria bacterium]